MFLFIHNGKRGINHWKKSFGLLRDLVFVTRQYDVERVGGSLARIDVRSRDLPQTYKRTQATNNVLCFLLNTNHVTGIICEIYGLNRLVFLDRHYSFSYTKF